MIELTTPITDSQISKLKVGDKIAISGEILTGRDAALPQLVELIEKEDIDLEGSVIMHTAVSDAGIAPTTSNKEEILSSIGPLSNAGVKIHIGKGSISADTIKDENSIFAITPPVAALLTSKVLKKDCFLFENEGIEAMYKLKVDKIPAIVAIANKKSIFERWNYSSSSTSTSASTSSSSSLLISKESMKLTFE